MWYKIFVEDEFINYFSDESNTFTIIKDGEKVLAPTFARFADIVIGVTHACAVPTYPQYGLDRLKEKEPDIFRGFAFYREHQPSKDPEYLAKIWRSIPRDVNTLRNGVDLEKLNAEQCAVKLMYPFWSRMGGSFEIEFQESGNLKKYLLALKNKIDNM